MRAAGGAARITSAKKTAAKKAGGGQGETFPVSHAWGRRPPDGLGIVDDLFTDLRSRQLPVTKQLPPADLTFSQMAAAASLLMPPTSTR